MGFRIGVDIGGTFTDFVVIDDEGTVTLWKEDSTPADPSAAIERGLTDLASEMGTTLPDLLSRTDAFVHGSTIATNTLIVRNGGPVGLLCTEGFRDVIYFRDGFKPHRFDIRLKRPQDFVDRYLRLGVRERIDADGSVSEPLDEDGVRAVAGRFREAGVKAVAVGFLWSAVNDAHERRAAEILNEELPEVPVLRSAQVLNEIREWERTSATVLSAYVRPRIGDYLMRLEQFLAKNELAHPAQYMQINGGCASAEEIMLRPVNTLGSGPAAAPAAAAYHLGGDLTTNGGEEAPDSANVITMDMGGTSFDVCLIRGGRPVMSRSIEIEFQPIGVPGVEVQSIGAGGGSIAWIDTGGALRVGPRSAGARPGPACYDEGGIEPTVTDANLVLGYLSPEAFLGGRRRLRDDLSVKAIQDKISDPLGLDVPHAAAGIVELVNAHMVGGVRGVSVERGIDPRGFTLVSGGGAGGLHAASIARDLEMRHVFIPPEASTFCAFGMAVTDVRHDYTASHHALTTTIDLDAINEIYADLEQRATDRLVEGGFDPNWIRLERAVDARYRNQIHELTIALPNGTAYSEDHLEPIAETFHREHHTQFSYSLPEVPVEFLHWRLAAFAAAPVIPRQATSETSEPEQVEERDAFFAASGGRVTTPVFSASSIGPEAAIEGPAIVESPTTTLIVNPGDRLNGVAGGGLLVEIDLPAQP